MEKISGILPASTRVTSVDLKSSGAVRSGTPNYGRPVGVSSAARREMEAEARAQSLHHKQMQKRAMDPQTEIVNKMADNFFNTRNEKADTQLEIAASEFMELDPDADLNPMTASKAFGGEVAEDDMDLPEVGAYLDVEI